MKHLLLDTEATDIGWGARLVQLAYKVMETGETVNEYFKPSVPITFDAMAVHHITNDMVADKPAFSESPAKARLEALLKDHILVAHNAAYDMTILYHEGITTPQYIDTVRVAKHVLESPRHSLQYLRYSLGLKVDAAAHDALGDVLVLESLFDHLARVVQSKFSLKTARAASKKMLALTQAPVLLQEIRFGKYKGKTFKEVGSLDEGYLEWLLRSESEKRESEQDEDLLYTLKHYLRRADPPSAAGKNQTLW